MRRVDATAWTLLLAVVAAPSQAHGAVLDGSVPILCAPQSVLECDAAKGCERVAPDAVDLPSFVTVDVGRSSVDANDGSGRHADIRSATLLDGRLVLQGSERGRGWSMVIEEAGALSVGVVDDRVAFNVFGRCTVR
jgi:hypothetical protein